MKAWLLDKLGGLENLHIGEMASPEPASGEVLLRVHFAALNPADRYLAEGAYPARPALPHILGRDGVGEIAAVGAGVTGWRPGQRAMLLRGAVGVERAGTFAEFVCVPADNLVAVPEGWTLQQAGGGSLTYLTAWQAITQWDLPPASNILITGASGGVGIASVQLAKGLGHRAMALSRSPAKQEKLRQSGAVWVGSPDDSQWRKSLTEYAGGRKVNLVIDNIGGAGFSDVVDVLGPNGRISVVGRLAGPVPQFNTASLFFRRLRVGGVAAGTYSAAEAQAAWQDILTTLRQAKAAPVIDRGFDFDELPQAFEYLARGPMGKVLLTICAG